LNDDRKKGAGSLEPTPEVDQPITVYLSANVKPGAHRYYTEWPGSFRPINTTTPANTARVKEQTPLPSLDAQAH